MKSEHEALTNLLRASHEYIREHLGTGIAPPVYLQKAMTDAKEVLDAREKAGRPSGVAVALRNRLAEHDGYSRFGLKDHLVIRDFDASKPHGKS